MFKKKNRTSRVSDLRTSIDLAPIDTLNINLPVFLMKQGKGWGASTTREEASALFNHLGTNPDDKITVFDVGANVGDYTDAVLQLLSNATVFSFEPSPEAHIILQKRFSNVSQVSLAKVALGKARGKSNLFADASGSPLASLTKRRLDHFGLEFTHSDLVDVVTLDEWCNENAIWPDVIKMDVEGHELDVLKGGENAVANARAVQFEFGGCNIDTRTFFQDFWYFFKTKGFEIWRITPSGLFKQENYSELDECFVTTNYIAFKKLQTL
jgi:FkbM family methyltransferase